MRADDQKPQSVIGFVQRNDSTILSEGAHTTWHHFLQKQLGLAGTVVELEKIWLRTMGGSGETLSDLWSTFLISQGYSGGLHGMIREYFNTGIVGPSAISGLAIWVDAAYSYTSDSATQFTASRTEYLECPSTSGLQVGTSGFFVSAWFYPDSVTGNQTIVSKFNTGSSGEFMLRLAGNQAQFIIGNGSTTISCATAAASIVISTWNHIVAWWDPADQKVYASLNGGAPVVSASTLTPANTSDNFRIAARSTGLDPFSGRIQHVGFWKGRIPTTLERALLFNSGAGFPYSSWGASETLRNNLAGYWAGGGAGAMWSDSLDLNTLVPGGAVVSRYLNNGGFETAGAGAPDTLGSWTETLLGTTVVVQDTVDFSTGAASARFDIDSSASAGQLSQTPLVSGTVYAFRIRAKTNGNGSLVVGGNTAGEQVTVAPTNAWATYTGCFVAASTTAQVKTSGGASSSIWVDNYTVWPVTPVISPTVLNGGFETAGGGGADVFAIWTETVSGTTAISRTTTAGEFVSGTAGMKIVVDGTGGAGSVAQTVLTVGQTYFASFSGKVDSGIGALFVGSDSVTNKVSMTASTSFSKILGSFTAGATSLIAGKTSSANKTLWMDDVYVMTVGFWSTEGAIGTGAATDGNPISVLFDKSGNGYHFWQPTLSARPILKTNILNGKPVVRFDGTDDQMSVGIPVTAMNGVSGITAFAVFQSTSSNNVRILTMTGAGSNPRFMPKRATTGEQMDLRRLDADSTTNIATPTTAYVAGQFYVNSYVADYANNAATIYQNGAAGPTGTTGGAGSTSATTPSYVRIGASTLFMNGDIAEVIVYSRALTVSERRRVEGYLSRKYNIAVS